MTQTHLVRHFVASLVASTAAVTGLALATPSADVELRSSVTALPACDTDLDCFLKFGHRDGGYTDQFVTPDDSWVYLSESLISAAEWDRLRAMGYAGVPGDGSEQLHVPAAVLLAVAPYVDTDHDGCLTTAELADSVVSV